MAIVAHARPFVIGVDTHARNHASWHDATAHGPHVLARVAGLPARVPGWAERPLDERERILADALSPLTLPSDQLRALAEQTH